MKNLKTADRAWILLAIATAIFELRSDDLLSEATERYIARHPILTRVVILAIAGHLACALPSCVDVFSAKNLVHRGVIRLTSRESR